MREVGSVSARAIPLQQLALTAFYFALSLGVVVALLSKSWTAVGIIAVCAALPAVMWIAVSPFRCLIVYAVLLPFEFYISVEHHVTSNQLLQVALFVRFAVYAVARSRQWPSLFGGWPTLWILLTAWIAWISSSLIWSIDAESSVKALLRVGGAVVAMMLSLMIVRSERRLRLLIGAIAVGASLNGLYALVQVQRGELDVFYRYFSPFYTQGLHDRGAGFSAVGTFSNPNILAQFGIVTVPLVLAMFSLATRRVAALAWLAAAAVLNAAVILTYSKAAWLWSTAALIVWIAKRSRLSGRALMIIVMSACVIAGVVQIGAVSSKLAQWFPDVRETSVGGRLELWHAALTVTAARPVVGYGLDAFAAATKPYRREVTDEIVRAHNVYLETMVDVGIPGLILFLMLIGDVYWMGLRSLRQVREEGRVILSALLLAETMFLLGGLTEVLAANQFINLQWLVLACLAVAAALPNEGRSRMGGAPRQEYRALPVKSKKHNRRGK